jgi:hypothetical protein
MVVAVGHWRDLFEIDLFQVYFADGYCTTGLAAAAYSAHKEVNWLNLVNWLNWLNWVGTVQFNQFNQFN